VPVTPGNSLPPDLVLDLTAFRLLRRGEPVKLQKTPMDVLTLLARKRGGLVTRDEIVAAIWGDAVHVDVDAGINTAIRKVRHALDDDVAAPRYLETVVGKGYRFIGPITILENRDDSFPPPSSSVMVTAARARLPIRHVIWAAMLGAALLAAALTTRSDIGARISRALPGHRGLNGSSDGLDVAEPYVRGRVEMSWLDRGSTPRAYFERALAIDPTYAPARAGLADFYRAQAIAADDGSEHAWSLAERYATEALALDETSAEAHIAVAQIRLMHDWDWPAAREHALRALQLNPGSPDAHAVYARYLRVAGHMHDAVDQRAQAAALDPLRPDLRVQLALEDWFAGDVLNAVASARQALMLDVNNQPARGLLCVSFGRLRRFDDSIVECGKGLALAGHSDWGAAAASEYQHHGYEAAVQLVARKQLNDILMQPRPDLWELANAYVLVGMRDKAIDTLFEGLTLHEPGLLQIRQDPDFDPIRDDPRYLELIRRIGFPSE